LLIPFLFQLFLFAEVKAQEKLPMTENKPAYCVHCTEVALQNTYDNFIHFIQQEIKFAQITKKISSDPNYVPIKYFLRSPFKMRFSTKISQSQLLDEMNKLIFLRGKMIERAKNYQQFKLNKDPQMIEEKKRIEELFAIHDSLLNNFMKRAIEIDPCSSSSSINQDFPNESHFKNFDHLVDFFVKTAGEQKLQQYLSF
jgi:hypothetical protein